MLCDINYPLLNDEEKKLFVHGFAGHAVESFRERPVAQSWSAQLLICVRCRNSYRKLKGGLPEPEFIPYAIEMLWQVLTGQMKKEAFSGFQRAFSAAFLELMTGDDSELAEVEEYPAFCKDYFGQWNNFYAVLAEALCRLGESILENSSDWNCISDILYGDIGENIIAQLENIYVSSSGGYSAEEFALRERQVYQSSAFCHVIRMFQQDMKEATAGGSLDALRERYQNEFLF